MPHHRFLPFRGGGPAAVGGAGAALRTVAQLGTAPPAAPHPTTPSPRT